MAGEPRLPTDLLTMIGGLGRNLVERLPDEPISPPLTPLEPFYGAGKAPRLSLRDIGSFLIPMSALDVGLAAVPPGKIGKPVAKGIAKRIKPVKNKDGIYVGGSVPMTEAQKKAAAREVPHPSGNWREFLGSGGGESELIPAIRFKDTGETLVGRIGDAWHDDVYRRHGISTSAAIRQRDVTEGFVDSVTGEWVGHSEAARRTNKLGEWVPVRRTTKRGITSMPAKKRRKD